MGGRIRSDLSGGGFSGEGNEKDEIIKTNEGAFLGKDDRVLKGPLGRSLRSFARTAHSAHSLRSAPLCFAPFTGSLTHFAHSLLG